MTLTLGGSEAAAAVGLDPYQSARMLALVKLGRVEREETPFMRLGTRLQHAVADELQAQLGYEVMPAPADGFVDESRPWMVGHPDYFTVAEGERAPLEIKTIWTPYAAHGWKDGAAPPHNVVQVLHYLHVTGLDYGVLCGLVGGRLEVRLVERDDRLLGRLLEAEEDFMATVATGNLPAPDGSKSAADALRAELPEATPGKAYRLLGEEWADYKSMMLWREARIHAQEKEDVFEQRIKAAAGDAELLIGPADQPVAKWATTTTERVDVTRLRKEAPHVAKTFLTQTTTRRFTLA